MSFADNLLRLPSVAHLAAIELLDDSGQIAATIPNQPGKVGSLTIYAAMATKHGRINTEAAQEALTLFAEHTDDARQHPGSHPNIDRLLEVIATGKGYTVKKIAA